MKVGSIVYATDQGLGYLAKAFYEHGVITHPIVVEHQSRVNNWDWYPTGLRVSKRPGKSAYEYIRLGNIDTMLFFETPFDWELIPFCRNNGIRTVLMTMYECEPKELPHQPDKIICPSLLDLQYYPQGKFIPVPVELGWKQRTKAEVFVHNAGNLGLKGRNGTLELLQALKYVKSPAEFVIRAQDRKELQRVVKESGFRDTGRVNFQFDFQFGSIPREELYSTGDVFIFPERFNGLSLPLQEAYAAGMLVMATDRFPMNTWLPTKPLIPVGHGRRSSISSRCNEFNEAILDPKDIAAKIDEWCGADITNYSCSGAEWARENSWEVLKPRYMEALSV